MARTQVFVTLELLRIISEFYHRQHHLRVSCLQVSVDIRNRQRALHSSGDSKHAWTLCSRCYTDNRACSCWDLQSLLVVSETWGCNLVQSINRQTPLFTIGGRRVWSTLWTDLCRRWSEAIENAQRDCIYTHALVILLFTLVFEDPYNLETKTIAKTSNSRRTAQTTKQPK